MKIWEIMKIHIKEGFTVVHTPTLNRVRAKDRGRKVKNDMEKDFQNSYNFNNDFFFLGSRRPSSRVSARAQLLLGRRGLHLQVLRGEENKN